jgi:hypothetical protein
VPSMHSDNGSADRIGSFSGRNDGCFGKQASLEGNRDEIVSKITKGEDTRATHEQVNMRLHLYELRREAKRREARDCMSVNFHRKTADEAMKLVPPGSKENGYMRMVLGYWEMTSSEVRWIGVPELVTCGPAGSCNFRVAEKNT